MILLFMPYHHRVIVRVILMESNRESKLLGVLLQKYYAKLVRVLAQCIEGDLLPALVSAQVITIDDKNTIKRHGNTLEDKAQYLLDNYVNSSLSVGITDNFIKLLEVMRDIPYCKSLADDLTTSASQLASSTPHNSRINDQSQLKEETSTRIQTGTEIARIELVQGCVIYASFRASAGII